jgi:hypothetical protein
MASDDEQFKYEVAFSFCFEDEPQVTELNAKSSRRRLRSRRPDGRCLSGT